MNVTREQSLPTSSKRPFRTQPGGNFRKFPRGLCQFPLSFLGESRRGPASSVKLLLLSARPEVERGEEEWAVLPQCAQTKHTQALPLGEGGRGRMCSLHARSWRQPAL